MAKFAPWLLVVTLTLALSLVPGSSWAQNPSLTTPPPQVEPAPLPPPQALYVPLDDRPCNWLFPQQLARIGGGQLLVPPRAYLGQARTPGQTKKLAAWLLKESAPGPAIIASDMLVYGGLLASRTSALSLEEALEQVQVLEELAQKGREVEVLATLPRLSLRTSAAQAPYEAALRNWASQVGAPPPAKVPPAIFQEYLGVRQRNLAVLERLLELAAQGSISRLVLGQDDSAPRGIHLEELAQLQERIESLGIAQRVSLMCGADELGCNMCAGWLARYYNYAPNIEFDYSDPLALEEIPPMETFTLAQTVELHLELSGARESEGTGTVLFVQTPSAKPFAAPKLEGDLEVQSEAQAMVERVAQKFASARPRPYGFADLHLVNRAEPLFAQTIMDNFPLWELACYSAWNTPSNALGTAIAQACVQQIARVKGNNWDFYRRLESEKTQQAFTMARLVDDYAYQAVIRQKLNGQYKDLSLEDDPLLNKDGPAGLEARALAIPWAQELWRQKLEGRTYYAPSVGQNLTFAQMDLEIVLPWPRLFEIEERLNLTLLPAPDPAEEASPQGQTEDKEGALKDE